MANNVQLLSECRSNSRIMLSPESANFIPVRQHDSDDDGIQEPGDVTELDTANSTVDREEIQTPTGIDSIDNRLRQSNMCVLSRYKVAYLILRWCDSSAANVSDLILKGLS